MNSTTLTPAACKKIAAAFLDERAIPYEKLTARTIDFTDLARATCVFVTVHGMTPPVAGDQAQRLVDWLDLKKLAVNNDFRVED